MKAPAGSTRPICCHAANLGAQSLTPALDHTMLVNRALELAGGLAAQRIRRAALWFEDAAEFAIALYACWRADVTACTPVEILPSVCEQIDADVDLWLTDTALPIPANRQRVPASWIGSRPLPTAALDTEIGGMVLYTSGSSAPKAVAKSWRQLVAETRALAPLPGKRLSSWEASARTTCSACPSASSGRLVPAIYWIVRSGPTRRSCTRPACPTNASSGSRPRPFCAGWSSA